MVEVLHIPENNKANNSRLYGVPFFQPKQNVVQRKEMNGEGTIVNNNLESYVESLSNVGQSLPNEVRDFYEPHLGYDLTNVKVHTDTDAARSAQSINALAYTSGNNIVFNNGQYSPNTDSGKKLLAHELTHVVQQNNLTVPNKIQKAGPATGSKEESQNKDAESKGDLFEQTLDIKTLIENGKLIEEPAIMGQEFIADCDSYQVVFKFPKAYKGIFNTNIPGYSFKGVYVNLEAHYSNKSESGRCSPLRLLQVLRYFKKDESGSPVTTEPTSPVNKIISGWGKNEPSPGWFVDTLANNPFYTSSAWGMEGNEGTENSPARLWDAPSYLETRNHGKEFYTCAVCENEFDKTRKIAACIKWGYYIDKNLQVGFYPSTPIASCNIPQEVIDATGRWDSLKGLQPTGITF